MTVIDVANPVRVIAASGAVASHTGDTSETALGTVTIPGGAMGANGYVHVLAWGTCTSSGNNKTPRVRWGGIGGDSMSGQAHTSVNTWLMDVYIQNANSASAQIASNRTNRASDTLVYEPTRPTGSQNTGADVSLVISGQLANSGESIALDGLIVELGYQP